MRTSLRIATILCLAAAGPLLHGRIGAMILDDSLFQVPIDRSGYIEVDGGKLFYETAGQGETIVFIHDGLLHRETWDYQFAAFSRTRRVVRYDRRGYGRSAPPEKPFSNVDDLHRVFTDLNIDRAILIGCSAGGGLAIDFTLAHPDRVTALVLVGAVVSGFGYSDHFFTRGGHLTQEIYADPDAFRNFWYTKDPYSIVAENTAARRRAAALLSANPHNLTAPNNALVLLPDRPALNFLSEITIPALIAVGESDIADVHAHAGAIDAGIPNSRRVVISKAGHLAHMEQPDQFNGLVERFFKQVDFLSLLASDGMDAAVDMLEKTGQLEPGSFPFSETRINSLGYEYLQKGRIDDAVGMFGLYVRVYSRSWNAYDSYAEALLAQGDTTSAIINYRKSLELNPDNTNAIRALEWLEAD